MAQARNPTLAVRSSNNGQRAYEADSSSDRIKVGQDAQS